MLSCVKEETVGTGIQSATVPFELVAPPGIVFPECLHIGSTTVKGLLFGTVSVVGFVAFEALELQFGLSFRCHCYGEAMSD